jgi:hypothetical protein
MTITSISAEQLTLTGRYLAGQLSDEESAAFEARFQHDPAVLRELEATARLKLGLRKLRERGELDALLEPAPWWQQARPLLATAAALAIVVLGVMLVRPMRAAHPLLAASITSLVDQQGSVLPVTRTLAVFRRRVEAYDAVIESDPAAGAVELRVLPETVAQSRRYRVTLSRVTDAGLVTTVASLGDLQPADDGFVTMFVDRSRLSPGRYRLDVLGRTRDGATVAPDAFLIRVAPPGSE